MKNSSDTIGNRYRDLPVSSAVPQPLHHRVPPIKNIIFVTETPFRKTFLQHSNVQLIGCPILLFGIVRSQKPTINVIVTGSEYPGNACFPQTMTDFFTFLLVYSCRRKVRFNKITPLKFALRLQSCSRKEKQNFFTGVKTNIVLIQSR
jgi:hypothetical protein